MLTPRLVLKKIRGVHWCTSHIISCSHEFSNAAGWQPLPATFARAHAQRGLRGNGGGGGPHMEPWQIGGGRSWDDRRLGWIAIFKSMVY